jgi:predicted amidophosphoribosyltransferase
MIALRKFELFEAATSLLYPPVCVLCGGRTQGGEYLCEPCEAKAIRIVAPFCQQCSEPFEGAIETVFM